MLYKKGDLIALTNQGEFDIIGHGCNCFCNMGAGIAKAIRVNFPSAYKADLCTQKGDKKKLGTFTYAHHLVSEFEKDILILNLYTQYNYGGGINANYRAIRECFTEIKRVYGNKDFRFGFPKIGAGLARGDWSIISEIIEEEMVDEDVTIVVL